MLGLEKDENLETGFKKEEEPEIKLPTFAGS